jgi:hypothetical protein
MKKKIFILGSERCGSTWVANVMDSHANVNLLMEPFADYAGLFPGFPGRFLYVDAPSRELCSTLLEHCNKLERFKYPLFYKPGKPLFWCWLDRMALRCHRFIAGLLGMRESARFQRYALLNLNQSEIPALRLTRKVNDPAYEITKEFRLNFKVSFLARLFPEAKYLILIRHPAAQLSSILSLMKRGSLMELRQHLKSFPEHVLATGRFEKYKGILKEAVDLGGLDDLLIVWWIVNNEVLIDDIKASGLQFQIIYHEQLSENPEIEFRKLFGFAGLDFSDEVGGYVNSSSNASSQTSSSVETTRNSRDHYKQTIRRSDAALREKIRRVLSRIEIIKEIGQYQAELEQS